MRPTLLLNYTTHQISQIWGKVLKAVADLDLKLGRGFVLLALPAFLPSVISSFLPKIGKGGCRPPRAPRSDTA